MSMPRRIILPSILVGSSMLLGGWFLQEGVSREENVYLQVRLFQEVMDAVSDQYVEETDVSTLYDSAIEGVLRELDDPNSSFIGASDWEDFRIRATDGDYAGVGLEVLPRDDFVTVMNVIAGGPGARAGIKVGDRFLEIDGQDAEGMPVDLAVDILRGEAGTEVGVMMGRPGVEGPIPFTLRRETIQLKSVPFAVVLEDNVGYVPLQSFRTTSSDEVRDEIRRLEEMGADRIVLDLRGNPGGLLDEGIDISELFLESGSTVVETRGRGIGQSDVYRARGGQAFPDLPLAVLVDENSASASEIVAGALQDHDRALVVGAPTYGKGSVQTLFQLTGGNVLRLTTAHWYTPVGRSIQKEPLEDEEDYPTEALSLDYGVVLTSEKIDRPEFTSRGGRTLLGGGGITPDYWVIQDTLTTEESRAVYALYSRGSAFGQTAFNFAVDYIQDRPGLARDFSLSRADVARFRQELMDAGVEISPAMLQTADRYIRRQLESQIALQAFGEEGQFLRFAEEDRQLQRAVEALQEASSSEALVATAGDQLAAAPRGD